MIVAYCRVHYGLDYLAYVMRSALPYVDKFIVLYTPVPTFGHWTQTPCPDSQYDLMSLAYKTIENLGMTGDKLAWIENELQSLDTVLRHYPQADIVLELDADEIIDPVMFEDIIVKYRQGALPLHQYTIPFLHHWRSFGWVCRGGDSARLYLPQNPQSPYGTYPDAPGAIHHMGYARSISDMRYKWELSVHKPELRFDWWDTKFLPWTPEAGPYEDLHPTMNNYWNAEPYDRSGYPDFMRFHPYYNMAVIE